VETTTIGGGAATGRGVMDVERFRTQYESDGYVRLAGGFGHDAAAGMARAVWAELERRHGIRPDDRSTWTVAEPKGLGALLQAGAFDGLGTGAVARAITVLLGTDAWDRPPNWGGALVTFPTPGTWAVPTAGWHLDWPARGAPSSQLLVKWLGYVSPVAPGGGATLVIAGSHHLVADWLAQADPADPGKSRTVRDAVFAMHPWFRDLGRATPGAGVTVRGVPVEVVELTGRPGDVVFLHPHLLHAASPNHGAGPRFMVTGQAIRFGPPRPALGAATPSPAEA
jgi:Phytanoyl-CoA dioxygenase (PhyH)